MKLDKEIVEENLESFEFDAKHLESFKALEQYKESPKLRSEKFTKVRYEFKRNQKNGKK